MSWTEINRHWEQFIRWKLIEPLWWNTISCCYLLWLENVDWFPQNVFVKRLRFFARSRWRVWEVRLQMHNKSWKKHNTKAEHQRCVTSPACLHSPYNLTLKSHSPTFDNLKKNPLIVLDVSSYIQIL